MWISSFFISLGIFTLVFSIGNLVKLVDLIINKGVAPLYIFKLFLMMLPFSLIYTFPIATLISTLLTFGKVSADNEIVVLKASGISAKKISIPFLILGLILSLISFISMNKLLPYTHYKTRQILFTIGEKTPTAYLEPGTFIKSFKDHIIFFYGIKKNDLQYVRIYLCPKDKPLRTIIAQKARIEKVTSNGLVLKLFNGTSDEINPQKPQKFFKLNFKQYVITLNLGNKLKTRLDKKPVEYTIKELKRNIKILKNKNIDTLPLVSELNKRYAQPFVCLAFILIGLPLGIKTRRREKSIGYGLGLLIIMFYYILFILSETLVLNRKIVPQIGHWIPTLTVAIIGIYFYIQMDKIRK